MATDLDLETLKHAVHGWPGATRAGLIVGVGAERMRQLAPTGWVRALPTSNGYLFDPDDVERLRRERAGEPERVPA